MSHPRTVLLALILLTLCVACEETSEPEQGTPAASASQGAGAPAEGTSSTGATPASTATTTPTAHVTATPTPRPITVAGIVDGDTIDVLIDGVEDRVRLILVDTPEVFGGEQCFGAEASAFVEELLPIGTVVELERDVSERDRFDRLLRYVYLEDGRMVNELLLEGGYAQVATFPPDVKHVDRFLALQREAREAGRGLWSACVDTPTPTPTVAPTPIATATPTRTPTAAPTPDRSGCHPSYPTVCIPPPPPDLDCGEIPFRRFRVIGSDPHRFDGDRDGIGCEN